MHLHQSPFVTRRVCMERVDKIKFLGTYITDDISQASNTITLVKKAQRQLKEFSEKYFTKGVADEPYTVALLRVCWCSASLFGMPASCQQTREPPKDYRCCLENKQLFSFVDISSCRCSRSAENIMEYSLHHRYHLFVLLPSGRSISYRQSFCETAFMFGSYVK